MSDAPVDLAVIGSPFLDLTFEDLPELPVPGRELFARELHFTPGGTGMTAIGAARLGLSVALVSPIGRDVAGRALREVFEAEGVRWAGPEAERTPVTAIFPSPEGAAMATHASGLEPSAEDVAAVAARAIVASLGRLPLVPTGTRVYAVTGPGEIHRFVEPPPELRGVHAVVLTEDEARHLTGAGTADDAAVALADLAQTAVVTRGREGSVGAAGSTLDHAAFPADAVDPTGAGDLFVAAYVWADLGGLSLAERLRWATLHASLSVTRTTALAGAARLDELLAAGRERGLTPP